MSDGQRIVVGISGASGMPILIKCLELIKDAQRRVVLIVTDAGRMTLKHEMQLTLDDLTQYSDSVYDEHEIGALPASGSWKTSGMLIVPCSMKTVGGIWSGYADNLLLRAADVTIKESRPLVLAARETPLNAIHLRNLRDLAALPHVSVIPPMMTYYHKPKSLDDMEYHIAAKLVEPFGIEAKDYRRWQGL